MIVHLIIVGHGWQYDGSFDPGATGYITEGEHKYIKNELVPAMKRHLPKDAKVIFYDEKKVSSHGNLVALVKHFNADQVTEIHFDAHVTGSTASGGHVIIHGDYVPDEYDLRLRDAIESMVGVRYSHKGHKGISGRYNLYNVNDARKNGVSYRLIELGFGTNRNDVNVMKNKVDAYGKALVKALFGSVSSKPAAPAKPAKQPTAPPKPANKTITQMAEEVRAGKHGTGHANRQRSLGIDAATYAKVRAEVNRRAGVSSGKAQPKAAAKSIQQMANEVRAGKHGTGHANRKKSLGIDDATYAKVRQMVNKMETGGTTAKKPSRSIDQMARQIINDPNAPNGHAARQKWLGVNNATYQKVRQRVNQLI